MFGDDDVTRLNSKAIVMDNSVHFGGCFHEINQCEKKGKNVAY